MRAFIGALACTLAIGVMASQPAAHAAPRVATTLWLVASAQAASSVSAPSLYVGAAVPATSYLYRAKLVREVLTRFGSTDAVARIAAQVHQESRWRADAASIYAQGMAQFTPATGAWLASSVCPEIGAHDPWNPDWSVRAVVCYDAWLHQRVAGASACDRWAFVLSAYNGGLRWVERDRIKSAAAGADPAVWFGAVATHADARRAAANVRQNRDYVARILTVLEPLYLAAGWPGQAVCA